MSSVEAKKEWEDHLKDCEQCPKATRGELQTKDDGTGWARSWVKCLTGRALWANWVNLMDKEYKNRQ